MNELILNLVCRWGKRTELEYKDLCFATSYLYVNLGGKSLS